jgi:N-sulfoglucosamine sulfohydrolase
MFTKRNSEQFLMKNFNLFIVVTLVSLITPVCSNENPKDENKRPNILFVIGDDISYPHMGTYGTKLVKTAGGKILHKLK